MPSYVEYSAYEIVLDDSNGNQLEGILSMSSAPPQSVSDLMDLFPNAPLNTASAAERASTSARAVVDVCGRLFRGGHDKAFDTALLTSTPIRIARFAPYAIGLLAWMRGQPVAADLGYYARIAVSKEVGTAEAVAAQWERLVDRKVVMRGMTVMSADVAASMDDAKVLAKEPGAVVVRFVVEIRGGVVRRVAGLSRGGESGSVGPQWVVAPGARYAVETVERKANVVNVGMKFVGGGGVVECVPVRLYVARAEAKRGAAASAAGGAGGSARSTAGTGASVAAVLPGPPRRWSGAEAGPARRASAVYLRAWRAQPNRGWPRRGAGAARGI